MERPINAVITELEERLERASHESERSMLHLAVKEAKEIKLILEHDWTLS